MKKYRLRYAPSPTGFLHIGNTRTALMSYLFAKHYNGDFIVRIEDTDLMRNVEGAIESQFSNLNWLGIFPDESIFTPSDSKFGEYQQSKKFNVYKNLAHKLVKENKAYYCFCTEDELEKDYKIQKQQGIVDTKYNQHCLHLTKDEIMHKISLKIPYSIRFLVPKNKIYKINDIVRNEVVFNSDNLGDFVILKSNGIATYNFAVVIDDHDMEITHVVRGEEHISNTPRQVMIYDAFNWEYPKFCHLTLIVDIDGKKLSKRSGNLVFFIEQYRNQGYLPQAIFNYIALLGWSPNINQEIFTKSELIKIFDEKRFTKAPSTFDMFKMKWFNNQYIKKMSENDYLIFIKEFIDNKYVWRDKDVSWLNEVLLLFKQEISYGKQINEHLDLFFENDRPLNIEILKELKQLEDILDLINVFKNKIESIEDWSIENIRIIIKNSGEITNKKGRNLFMPIRFFSSKFEHGPSLANVIYLIGKKNVLNNIEEVCLNLINLK